MKALFALMALAMLAAPATSVEAALRFGTGSAVSHRVEELDRRIEEQQRLNNTSNINSPDVELMDNVKVLDGASAQKMTSISSDSGTFKFSSTTEQLVSLDVGDVLVVLASDTNHFPLMRVITGIEPDGAGMTIVTRQAAITEVIKRCDLAVTHTFTIDDFQWQDTGPVAAMAPAFIPQNRMASRTSDRVEAPAMAPPLAPELVHMPDMTVTMEGSRIRIDVKFDSIAIYDADGNLGTTADQIVANGSLVVYPIDVTPKLVVSYGRVQLAEIQMNCEIQGRVDYTWGVSISGRKYFPSIPDIPIAPIPLIPPPCPPFLYIQPVFSAGIVVEGEISGKVVTAVYATAKVGVIGRWTPEKEVEVFPTWSIDVDYDEPNVAVTGTVNATGLLGLAGYLDSCVGIKVQAGFYGKAEIDAVRPPYPWWRLSAGTTVIGSLSFRSDAVYEKAMAFMGIDKFPQIVGEWEWWEREATCTGTLQVRTNDARSHIYVDNVCVATDNYSGAVDAKAHLIHYGPIAGMKAPPDTTVTVVYAETTVVYGEYLPDTGILSIGTNRNDARIYVNGQQVALGGYTSVVRPGQYVVSFGPVAGKATPPDRTVTVVAGGTVNTYGEYKDFAVLNLSTNIPGSPVFVNAVDVGGAPCQLQLYPGYYQVVFGDVESYMFMADNTPWPADVRAFFGDTTGFLPGNPAAGILEAGQTYNLVGNYVESGELAFNAGVTLTYNGYPAVDPWNMLCRAPVPVGSYDVGAGTVDGFICVRGSAPWVAGPTSAASATGGWTVASTMEGFSGTDRVEIGHGTVSLFDVWAAPSLSVEFGNIGSDGEPWHQATSLTDNRGVKVYVDGVFWNGGPLPYGEHVVSFENSNNYGHPDPVTVTTSPDRVTRVYVRYY